MISLKRIGQMMTRAYPDYYLDDAQREVGAMLDYAVNGCGEDLAEFYARFLASGLAWHVSQASPKYLGMSGTELAMLVAERTGAPLPEKEPLIFPGSPEYWTGWILAYVSWYLNMDFETLQRRGISAERICLVFHPLHEADVTKTVDLVQRWLEENAADENPLKQQRKMAGLTQQELADMTGIPLRVVRSYEQGQRSLSNANAATVLRLSQVLACRAEDILSYSLELQPHPPIP